MKKSRKLLCMLLALVMVVSLLPVMAFAADEDIAAEEVVPASVEEISPETAGIITDAFAKLPRGARSRRVLRSFSTTRTATRSSLPRSLPTALPSSPRISA